ncbi:MAG: MFS transporter, partial [Candidatus Bathyarchaeia archaeon]
MDLKFHSAFLRYLNELDRRFKVVLAAIGAYNWAYNLSLNYNQLYAIALGASPIELSSLNSVGAIVSSLISVPAGWLIDRHGVKNMLMVGLILSAIVSAIYGYSSSWLMLIPAVVLTQIGFKLIIPLADIIFVGTSRAEGRAQAMGMSRAVWAIPALLAPMVAAFIVTAYGGINVQGIRPLFFLQLISTILVIVFTFLTLEEMRVHTTTISKYDQEANIGGLIDSFRDLFKGSKGLIEWVILMGIWRFEMSISMPFITLWMAYVKGADPYVLGAVSTVGLITSALLQIPVGRMADRVGRKKVFFLVRPLT